MVGGLLGVPVCVCPKVKEMSCFQLQVNKLNEKMSFKVGVKFAISFYMGRTFLDIWHVFGVKINLINKTYGIINAIYRQLILTSCYHLKWVEIT